MIIYKYQLNNYGASSVAVAKNSTILKVAYQNDQLCIWFNIPDKTKELESRTFNVLGTGTDTDIEDFYYDHIDTLLTKDEKFVWHIFEVKEKK